MMPSHQLIETLFFIRTAFYANTSPYKCRYVREQKRKTCIHATGNTPQKSFHMIIATTTIVSPLGKDIIRPATEPSKKKVQPHLRQIPFSISLRELALKFERNFTKIIHSDVFYPPPLILTSLNSSRITTTLPTPDARLAINCIQQTRSPSVIATLQVIWQ